MTEGRITVLIENSTGGRGLLAEHGLSVWIEYGSRRILYDTGQSDILFHNARVLGIDLSTVDAVVFRNSRREYELCSVRMRVPPLLRNPSSDFPDDGGGAEVALANLDRPGQNIRMHGRQRQSLPRTSA